MRCSSDVLRRMKWWMKNERPSDVVRDIRNLNGRSNPLERAFLFLSVDSFRALLPYGK